MQDALHRGDKAGNGAGASQDQVERPSAQTDMAQLPDSAPQKLPDAAAQEGKKKTRRGSLGHGRGKRRQGGTNVNQAKLIDHGTSATPLPLRPSQALSSGTGLQPCLQLQGQATASYRSHQIHTFPVVPVFQHMQQHNGQRQQMQSQHMRSQQLQRQQLQRHPEPFVHRSTGVDLYANSPLSMVQQQRQDRRGTAEIPPALLPLVQLALIQRMGMRPPPMQQWQQPGHMYRMQPSSAVAAAVQRGLMQRGHM